MASIRPGAKLEEEGGEEISSVFLLDVPEVKKKICHQSQSSLAHPVDFPDDCGPRKVRKYPILTVETMKGRAHQNSFPTTRYSEGKESGLS